MGKPPRNPRRAYDENGKEIPPVTVASSRASGLHTVAVFCEVRGCLHDAVISLDGWPDDMPTPDMALHLRCSKCGGRSIKVMLNVLELYAQAHGVGIHEEAASAIARLVEPDPSSSINIG